MTDTVGRAIYIVSGIPGAGKTTVARLLAQRFERGVHIESDQLQKFIVHGGVWPDGRPSYADGDDGERGTVEEGQRQLHLRYRNAQLLADSYFEAGFAPVIDDVVIGSHVEGFGSEIRNRPLRFVLLVPAPDVVRQRDATRPEKHVFEKWGYLDEVMRNETPNVGLWLDSWSHTAAQTVAEIVRRAAEAEIT